MSYFDNILSRSGEEAEPVEVEPIRPQTDLEIVNNGPQTIYVFTEKGTDDLAESVACRPSALEEVRP